ncbi:MAG: acetylglutamate kinase [Bacteroidetes bacterium]|nr:acetylglutamate kinase [Bacteroidota bacterium]
MEKLFVVKVGGAVLEDTKTLDEFLQHFAELEGNKILIHGGGRSATQLSTRLGIETKMIDGRRITDEETISIVTMVYGGLINKKTVAVLQSKNCNALGLTGADMNLITAIKRPVKDIDYGFVGDIVKVDNNAFNILINAGFVPIIAPLTHDKKGQLLNTNADTIASSISTAMVNQFDVSLIYCFEKEGVLSDPENELSVISELNRNDYQQYLASGVIHSGMIPKLDNSFKALELGVKSVVITNANSLNSKKGTHLTL